MSTIGDMNMLEYPAAAIYVKVHHVSLSDTGKLLREQAESTSRIRITRIRSRSAVTAQSLADA